MRSKRDVLARLAHALQGLQQTGQRRLHGSQEALAFLGQRHAAHGAVKQVHSQVSLQRAQNLAGRLRRKQLCRCRLAEAAQLGGAHKGGDGAQFIDQPGFW